MARDKDWQHFEDYIAERLKEIDPYARASKGSGNKNENYDINTSAELACECKQRATKDITVKNDVWDKLCQEIPLHSEKIPVYMLENKEKKRWAVLELDDFLDLFIDRYKLREEGKNV